MGFLVSTADILTIQDQELTDLLTAAYVNEGFVSPELAGSLFEPNTVRRRGVLIGAREHQQMTLAGVIILVPPESIARQLAQANEAELHLLGVSPQYRNLGLGKLLIDTATNIAAKSGFNKILLWTQTSMHAAQHVYESMNFIRGNEFQKNGKTFILYEKTINSALK